MKRTKHITQTETVKIAKNHIASIGSCFAPTKNIYGTITRNSFGYKYNTSDVSIMLYTPQFWDYWNMKAKSENLFLVLYADKQI